VKTLLAIGFLVLMGLIVAFLAIPVLNLAGLPGALLSRNSQRTEANLKILFGTFLSIIGQSYIYLAYTAFVVNWTALAIAHQNVSGFLLWPPAILAVMVPILRASFSGIKEDIEDKQATSQAQLNAVSWVTFLAPIGFCVFAFMPNTIGLFYSWVPFVQN
jgi:hypothetical protein